jgi:hypothetical protein
MSNGGTIIQVRQVSSYNNHLDPLSLGEIVFNTTTKSLGVSTVSSVNWLPEILKNIDYYAYVLQQGVKFTGRDSNNKPSVALSFPLPDSLYLSDSNSQQIMLIDTQQQTTKYAPSNTENKGAAYFLYMESIGIKSGLIAEISSLINPNPIVYIPNSNLVFKGVGLTVQNKLSLRISRYYPHRYLGYAHNSGSSDLLNARGIPNETVNSRVGLGFQFDGTVYPSLKGCKLSSLLPKHILKAGYTLFAQVSTNNLQIQDFSFKTSIQNKAKTKKFSIENHLYGAAIQGKSQGVCNIVFKLEDYMFTQEELSEGLIVDWLDEGSILLSVLTSVDIAFNTFGVIPDYRESYKSPLIEVLYDPINPYALSGQYNNLIQIKMNGGDINYLNFNKKLLNSYSVELYPPNGISVSAENLTEDGFTLRPTVYPATGPWKLSLYIRPIV